MKPHIKYLSYSILFALTGSVFASHTRTLQSADFSSPQKVYIGIFGGGGSSNEFNVTQQGTAFYFEALGGPLAVNGFGHVNSHSNGFFGAQLGYQWEGMTFNHLNTLTIMPAVELEGYYLTNSTFHADLINNTARLDEHDFLVSYPMRRTVFLANYVLNFGKPCLLVQPYIGFGIGSAIVRIAGADASQISPPEVGVNHYNSNPHDTDATFAGQIKAGLSYDINKCVSVFAEYRWLYIANTHFQFGSTVYPEVSHPETSPWLVKLDPQRYNMGSVGVRFNL